ncbi:SusC/RagA family TonB-linked outer membrane protein [Fulvivirga maritima]|uniref:SusC/RagA family TonB-linked outer membrane protein n=1 Tax=Fulvivirga maritima TaxID=2904247 RepID=UPI001F3D25EE|nr:SusC/RagA family TonB-linked outer membrane protein [Fulvivirga maritima]UII26417.1 SusC/RagA family TonB-linked outer membrane protein [Fulvivirga maritima]
MKYYIQKLLSVSKRLLYVFLVEVLAMQLVFANTTVSQSLENVPVSITVQNVRLTEIFNTIENETDFEFAYNSKVKEKTDLLTLVVSNGNLKEVLESIALQTHLNFKRINNNIYVYEPADHDAEVAAVEEQADFTITGVVRDGESREPLPGASVVVANTSIGAITDMNGVFTLDVPEEATILVISYVGYLSKEVALASQTNIEVALQPDVTQLDELVVLGYDVQTKRDLTGAVATVNPDQIKSLPPSSVEKMLDGRMAGVQVLTDNAPGGNVTVRVRGYGTVNNNDPLYIIDGVPVSNGLNTINPSDIATIQVLKDAAAASIYGSRAANGVVIITTKTGSSDEAKITFNAYAGVQKAFNLPRMLSAQEYGDMLWQAAENDGTVPSHDIYGNDPNGAVIPDYLDDAETIPSGDVDWVDAIFDPAVVQSYNLSVSKGNDKARQAFSIGYFNQEGIIKHTGFDRFTTRFNSSYKIKDLLEIGQNFGATYSRTTSVGTNSSLGSIVYNAMQFPSIVPIKDVNGKYAGNPINDISNPLGDLERSKDNVRRNIRLLGNVYVGLNLGDFAVKSNLGIDYHNYNNRNFSPQFDEILATNNVNSLSTSNSFNYQLTWSNTLTYNKTIGDHKFDLLLGEESVEFYEESFSGSRQNFFYEDETFRYLSSGTENQLNTGSASDWALLSFFGKVNYSLKDRYLFSATMRRDGTSRLSNNNWGTFPAFSAGWVISEESFFNVQPVSFLKLRGSWGQAGNQQVPVYSTLDSYTLNPYYANYSIDGAQEAAYTGIVPSRVPNADLKWEVTTQSSIGLDVGLLGDRLELTAEYFRKTTDDILIYKPIPITYGGTNDGTWVNGGQMKNSGIELTLGYKGKVSALDYNLGLNITAYKNEMTELNDVAYLGIPTSSLHSVNFDQDISRTQVGKPIGSFYGYEAIGIFKSEEEIAAYGLQPDAKPGDLIFKDVTGDGELNANDRTFIGSPHPDMILGLNMNFYYKGFDLALLFNGSFGNDIYNLTKYKTHFFNQSAYNKNNEVLGAWTPENPGSEIPRVSLDDPNNNIRVSSFYVEDGTYFKLYNVQLGYTFPSQKGMELRLYGQVNNVFTITGYDGMTPEIGLQSYSNSNRNLDIGIDRGLYPPSRTFTLGVNMSF